MNLGKETETLEFKKTTGEMKEAMISISSILNKHGIGTLYFGVKKSDSIAKRYLFDDWYYWWRNPDYLENPIIIKYKK